MIHVLETIEASYYVQEATEKMRNVKIRSLLIFRIRNKPLGFITEQEMLRKLDQVNAELPESLKETGPILGIYE